MGDRSGSREPKGASLKKSKKNPGASAAKAKKLSLKAMGITSGPVASMPPPLPVNSQGFYFDCGVALLSRQFDRDRDRVLQRAQFEGHCVGLLQWFADIEKQTAVAELSKTNSGFVYYATGIHPDNVDRTNKKSHDEWLEKVEELGKKAECLALISGTVVVSILLLALFVTVVVTVVVVPQVSTLVEKWVLISHKSFC
jgi:hypothetical protein